MCGISGFLSFNRRRTEDGLHSIAVAMSDSLAHRGPDDSGVWVDGQSGVALGHRRLSILDLSAAGKQPMESESGRFVIVYNGEIYNFPELRRDLEGGGHRFRGHSDTEVLLAAIEAWGIEESLRRANGMLAFALWDRERRALILARDRVGKKPLYYGWCGETFLFGSELKALRRHPDFDDEIDTNALGLFVQYSWVPGPRSIFRRIRKLPAGTLLTVSADGVSRETEPECYWSAREAVERGNDTPFCGSFEEATERLDELLRDSVRGRMLSDVSLGALLSGGIDSTLVVALMQASSSQPIKTFTIGFADPRYNEAGHARALADHLGTDHTELTVTPEDSLEVIPGLATLFDEPFADPSQIPTFIVSRLARSKVTVALSGDGGDEVFAGYRRYLRCLEDWKDWGRLPLSVRRGVACSTSALARLEWRLLGPGETSDPKSVAKWRRILEKLDKRTSGLGATSPLEHFSKMRARCERAGEFVIGADPVPSLLTDTDEWADVPEPLHAMMYLDFAGYLPDNNLVKVDRASMGVSLEVRSPLLDYRVAELAWSLPPSMLIEAGRGKRILRRVLERYVPRDLTDRPKWGFGVPISDWLRGPLRAWAESLLDENRLRQEGVFHPAAVRRVWRQHLSGWRDHRELLWNILMFQAWREAWPHAAK